MTQHSSAQSSTPAAAPRPTAAGPARRRSAADLAVTVFFGLGALLSLVTGAGLLVPGTPLDAIWRPKPEEHAALLRQAAVAGPGFLLLGVVLAAASALWWHGRRLARWLAVLVVGGNMAGDLAHWAKSPAASGLLPVLVAGVLLAWLLRRRRTRGWR